MQTSLQRRRARRRNGGRGRSGGVARTAAIALPLFLFATFLAVAGIALAHAAWWQSPRLEPASWLSMTGFLAVEQMQQVVARCWQPFLARLSVPVTPALRPA